MLLDSVILRLALRLVGREYCISDILEVMRANRFSYWFKYIIVTPNQLTAAALVIQYWVDRDTVNPGVFIAIFLVTICVINYFGIRFFGELEFWLSSFKVIVIIGIILFSLVLALGGGPDHDRKGFRYWSNPGYVPQLFTLSL